METNSSIAAGTIRWGAWGARMTTTKIADLIGLFLANGIDVFDISDVYGNYTTEAEIGEAISSIGIHREEYKLITKCGIIKPCSAKPDYSVSHYDTSKEYIISSIEQSLINLKTDYIDLFLLSRPHPAMNYHEIAEAFDIIRSTGKAKELGVVSFNNSQLRTLSKYTEIDTHQLEFSMTNLEPLENGTIDTCQELDINMMSWSPIGGGSIFTNSKNGKKLEERLLRVADKYQWTLTEMALLFLGYMPSNIIPIINQNKIEKYLEAADIMQQSITNEQWFEILYAVTGNELS